jgi:hypothetical protein
MQGELGELGGELGDGNSGELGGNSGTDGTFSDFVHGWQAGTYLGGRGLPQRADPMPELQPQDPGSNGEPGTPSVLLWVVRGKKFARSIGRSDRENAKSVIQVTRPARMRHAQSSLKGLCLITRSYPVRSGKNTQTVLGYVQPSLRDLRVTRRL